MACPRLRRGAILNEVVPAAHYVILREAQGVILVAAR